MQNPLKKDKFCILLCYSYILHLSVVRASNLVSVNTMLFIQKRLQLLKML